nr:MAG TPA: hypothetical protein [Bacteriophage sp.]
MTFKLGLDTYCPSHSPSRSTQQSGRSHTRTASFFTRQKLVWFF